MAGTNLRETGDFEVFEAVDAVIPSGSVVVPSTTPSVNPGVQGAKVAGDAAKNVLGVAARRANPVSGQTDNTTDADGYNETLVNHVTELTTVYSHGVVRVTYTAAAVAYGAKIAAAANGAVRAWVSADGADAIIGTCKVVGGMSSAGGLGFAKINV